MSQQWKRQIRREVIQHLAFVLFFVAGLLSTDVFMGHLTGHRPEEQSAQWSTPPAQPSAPLSNSAAKDRPAPIAVRTSFHSPWPPKFADDDRSALDAVRQLERQRIETARQVIPAVVSVFGLQREGGGSGVLIHPSGLALTNHHVVAASGAEGWAGLADGSLYRWQLVGNDPGGDLALIQLTNDPPDQPFPFVRLGDSDQVQVGDWTMVMGNPFNLAEDYQPTVTYGIVSGVNRYQPGMSDTLLVYGNCIQVDTSINPGNSGGPLFDMQGQLIGINGRASFEFRQRGRVNVGLGYAISVNQCRNFLPELMATKLIQHGTLDAVFGDRDGRVVCTAIYEDADIAKLGLALGDELLQFEGVPIRSANQFTNLICTLPAAWPAQLTIRKPDGRTSEIRMRLLGLPYPISVGPPGQQPGSEPEIPQQPPERRPAEAPQSDRPRDGQDSEADKPDQAPPQAPPALKDQIEASQKRLAQFMSHPPGIVQDLERNQRNAAMLWQRWLATLPGREPSGDAQPVVRKIVERWEAGDQVLGQWVVTLGPSDGELQVEMLVDPDQDPPGWPAVDQYRPQGNRATPQQRPITAWKWQEGRWLVGRRAADAEQVGDVADAEAGADSSETAELRESASDYQWEVAEAAELATSMVGSQVQFLAGLHDPRVFQAWGAPLIDGVDPLDRQVMTRLRFGPEATPWYVWLSLDDWTQAPDSRLFKTATDINGRRGPGGVRFDDWDDSHSILWPTRRRVVSGLFEDLVMTIHTESIEVLP